MKSTEKFIEKFKKDYSWYLDMVTIEKYERSLVEDLLVLAYIEGKIDKSK